MLVSARSLTHERADELGSGENGDEKSLRVDELVERHGSEVKVRYQLILMLHHVKP
jgi:hypothetical protein